MERPILSFAGEKRCNLVILLYLIFTSTYFFVLLISYGIFLTKIFPTAYYLYRTANINKINSRNFNKLSAVTFGIKVEFF